MQNKIYLRKKVLISKNWEKKDVHNSRSSKKYSYRNFLEITKFIIAFNICKRNRIEIEYHKNLYKFHTQNVDLSH